MCVCVCVCASLCLCLCLSLSLSLSLDLSRPLSTSLDLSQPLSTSLDLSLPLPLLLLACRHPELKRLICKRCSTLLRPGLTSRVRIACTCLWTFIWVLLRSCLVLCLRLIAALRSSVPCMLTDNSQAGEARCCHLPAVQSAAAVCLPYTKQMELAKVFVPVMRVMITPD